VLKEEQARRLLKSIKVVRKVAPPEGSESEQQWLMGLRDRAVARSIMPPAERRPFDNHARPLS
jgi:hypothetical protein